MKPKAKVSLQKIANHLGISRAAVSMALNNKKGISNSLKIKILEASKTLGYEPNPTISRFMSDLRQHKITNYKANLAWIHGNLASSIPIDRTYWNSVYSGAQKKATSLGYGLEKFLVSTPNLTNRRLFQVLKARGIAGLLIGEFKRSFSHLRFPMHEFSAVAINYGVIRPALPRVCNNHLQSILESLRILKRKKYRRIGFFLVKGMDQRTSHNWTAGTTLFQHLHSKTVKIIIHVAPESECESEDLCAWIQKEKLDAIITPHNTLFQRIQEGGIRIPQDLGFISLDVHSAQPDLSGIDQNPVLIGEVAVSALHTLVNLQQYANTSPPTTTLVDGIWREGTSIRSA